MTELRWRHLTSALNLQLCSAIWDTLYIHLWAHKQKPDTWLIMSPRWGFLQCWMWSALSSSRKSKRPTGAVHANICHMINIQHPVCSCMIWVQIYSGWVNQREERSLIDWFTGFLMISAGIYLPYRMTVAKVQGRHDLSEKLPGFFGR